MKLHIFLVLPMLVLSACSESSTPKNNSFFDAEFSQNLEKVEIFIAGYQTHVEETSTEIVDAKASATLSLNCGASCYQDNLKALDATLATARTAECYPTFFMQKFVVQSTDETVVFYLDFDGRQIKFGEQCYQLDGEYQFSVGDLGMMSWEKRR